jgi:hypothetical protein
MRGTAGALLGAVAAGAALRLRNAAKNRQVGLMDVLSDAPEILSDDIERVASAARGAYADGRRAMAEREREIDEALRGIRRTGEME